MVKINPHFQKLSQNYLFQEIDKRVTLFKQQNPTLQILNLGIGDISEPLPPYIVKSICSATKEMGKKVIGYGPSEGYPFLREAIAQFEYKNVTADEIFIFNGSKNAISAIETIFDCSNTIGLMDPTYPVYKDSNIIAGKSSQFIYLPCREQEGFLPSLPNKHCDLIYLCSPNNPTGVSFSRKELEKWVSYAKEEKSIIIFDTAYEAFITSNAPRSIYEIEGAREVAIEFKSFSKKAGFTNLRCSYLVIPKELGLSKLWQRNISAKFGGVPYPIQKGAEAIYHPQGQKEIKEQLDSYKERTLLLMKGLSKLNFSFFGGIDSPFVWCKTINNTSSWDFFDLLLKKATIISIPGSGFGPSGEGFVRFSAFAKRKEIEEAMHLLTFVV